MTNPITPATTKEKKSSGTPYPRRRERVERKEAIKPLRNRYVIDLNIVIYYEVEAFEPLVEAVYLVSHALF